MEQEKRIHEERYGPIMSAEEQVRQERLAAEEEQKSRSSYPVQLQGTQIIGDRALTLDITVALCHFSERLAKEIGTTGDLHADADLAQQLVTVRKVYDKLSELVGPV